MPAHLGVPDHYDRNINAVRGLVCVLLVIYHVVGVDEHAGMHMPGDSMWHYVTASMDFIRMPAFGVLAGYLYARRRIDRAGLRRFWHKKACHLFVPLVFGTVVTWMLRRQVYGVDDPLLTAVLFHYQHFWFLQAILIVFAAVTCWDCLRRPGWMPLTLAMFGLLILTRSIDPIAFLSLGGAVYLAPYFIFGMLLREHRALFMRQDVLTLAGGVVAIVLLAQQGALTGELNPLPRSTIAAALCGMGSTLLLLRFMPLTPVVEVIGGYSYTIYLWHSISAAAARRLAGPVIGSSPVSLFIVMFVAGVLAPILLHRLVRGLPIAQTLFTGETSRAGWQWRGGVSPQPALRRR